MERTILNDGQWAKIKNLLPGKKTDCGVTAKSNRTFVEAVLWIARTGAPWRDLPKKFGSWYTVYTRYYRWSKKHVWQNVFELLAGDADIEFLMVDGSIVRVHQHGASKKQSVKSRVRDVHEGA